MGRHTRPRRAGSPGGERSHELKVRVAQEAARIMSEHGVRDYAQARRKAGERFGLVDEQSLPKIAEVENALREYQRLFQSTSQPDVLRERRETAIEAMKFFAAFDPRLVGAVLDGTADAHSPVSLHLHTDDVLAVQHHLDEHRVPFVEDTRRLRYDREREPVECHVYRFRADDVPVELTLLPRDGLRQAPIDRDDRPVERASLSALIALMGR